MGKLTRRVFLGLGVAAVGGLVVGYRTLTAEHPNPLPDIAGAGEVPLNPWLIISESGEITVIAPRAEMGQAVSTGLAMLVAEELGVALSDVTVIHGPAAAAYYNGAMLGEGGEAPAWDEGFAARIAETAGRHLGRVLGLQATGGSTSVLDGWTKMRVAGAAAREALIAVAAGRMKADAASLVVEGKAVKNPATGEAIGFGALAAEAATREPPEHPALTPVEKWRLIGKPQKRVDLRPKVTGAPIFGIDVELPEMLHATPVLSPVFGGKGVAAALDSATAVPGVVKVIAIDHPAASGWVVIARDTWSAFRGAEELAPEWEAPRYPADAEAQRAALIEQLNKERPDGAFEMGVTGDAPVALRGAPKDEILDVQYEAPMLAHACMEPMNCTAQIVGPRLRIWSGNQSPTLIQDICGPLAGLSASDVEVTTLPMGGGFGRRFEVDVPVIATLAAMQTDGRPVKVTWRREEDMTHDMYRPPAIARMRAHVRPNEPAAAIEIRTASPSVLSSVMGRTYPAFGGGADKAIVDGLFNQPGNPPHLDVQGIPVDLGVPVGFWRSVGNSQNAFFHEGLMDEIAVKAGRDPVGMRLDLYEDEAFRPARLVLDKAADMAGWGRTEPGRAKGVAVSLSFRTWVAQVVEVSQGEGGAIRVENVWCAVDPGVAVDPDAIAAQMEGGIIFGLSAAIGQKITFAEGRVQETNFDSFDGLRMAQAPRIAVEILQHSPFMGGIGEPGVPPAAPALANAIFALTGTRLRRMPFGDAIDFV